MSGWIKIEKDLLTDPRFVRMAKAICKPCNAGVTQVRCSHHDAVTEVLGSLARLWIYADSHIREDDTLDLGTDEINEVVGFQGFTALMPVDWLEVVNPHCVELIGFQEHNGAIAKKKAVTAKRVARHRIRNVTQESNDVTLSSNAPALPDQTRPDQTRPYTETSASITDATAEVEIRLQALYPKLTGRPDWISALRAARQLIETGQATWDGMIAAVTRYAAFVAAGGVSGPQYVLTPVKFFSAPDRPWSLPWDPPAKQQTETDKRVSRETAELQALADGRAVRQLAHCRDPGPADTPETYATYLKLEERSVISPSARARDLGVASLAASKRMAT